eukprot:15438655-Alexandrium_andersonii.AAC.1
MCVADKRVLPLGLVEAVPAKRCSQSRIHASVLATPYCRSSIGKAALAKRTLVKRTLVKRTLAKRTS